MSGFTELGSGEAILCFGPRGLTPSPTHTMLAEKRRVILFDAPGDEVAAALDALGLARFDILAEGNGATAALALALERPAETGAIVLAAPGPLGPAVEARLGAITAPVLTLCGANDDASRSIAALPHGHLMYVYDAGDDMLRARPEALAFIVREFLERRELFIVTRESGVMLP
jgi:pimeloyl-ACP methyl ester carboxylesterase